MHVAGWAVDPDLPATPLSIIAFVDGTPIAVIDATQSRPDVTRGFPQFPPDRGYDTVLPVLPGAHRLCLSAGNATLGCADLHVAGVSAPGPHDPRGSLDRGWATDAATGYVTVWLDGWAFDPDTHGPWTILVRAAEFGNRSFALDPWPVAEVSARTTVARPDVQSAFPAAGPSSGWSTGVGWPQKYVNPRYVCAYALGTGPGAAEALLGCRSRWDYRSPAAP